MATSGKSYKSVRWTCWIPLRSPQPPLLPTANMIAASPSLCSCSHLCSPSQPRPAARPSSRTTRITVRASRRDDGFVGLIDRATRTQAHPEERKRLSATGSQPGSSNGWSGPTSRAEEAWSDFEEGTDVVQQLLDVVVPPLGLAFVLVASPVVWTYNFARWLLGFVFYEDVRNKAVVITGASSGIGEQLAYQYAKRGARLVLVARREDKLSRVCQRAREMGAPDATWVAADVAREEECKKLVEHAVGAYGRIDHLVLNAGIATSFKIEEAESADLFQKVMDTNFMGVVRSAYFALPYLRQSHGRLVVTASTASWLPVPRMSVYNASKAALMTFFDTLRAEVGSDLSGITMILPGYVQSELMAGKLLGPDGSFNIDTNARDTVAGPAPVAPTVYCARKMISGVLRGERYVVVPSWYKVSQPLRVFTPEILDGLLRLVFATDVRPGTPVTKAIMEAVPSLEKVSYPPGMQNNEKKQRGE